jgi:hypothetical protein
MSGCTLKAPMFSPRSVFMFFFVDGRTNSSCFPLLFVFRSLRKIAESACELCHVRPSVRAEQLGSRWTDFHDITYLSFFFPKIFDKIQVSL